MLQDEVIDLRAKLQQTTQNYDIEVQLARQQEEAFRSLKLQWERDRSQLDHYERQCTKLKENETVLMRQMKIFSSYINSYINSNANRKSLEDIKEAKKINSNFQKFLSFYQKESSVGGESDLSTAYFKGKFKMSLLENDDQSGDLTYSQSDIDSQNVSKRTNSVQGTTLRNSFLDPNESSSNNLNDSRDRDLSDIVKKLERVNNRPLGLKPNENENDRNSFSGREPELLSYKYSFAEGDEPGSNRGSQISHHRSTSDTSRRSLREGSREKYLETANFNCPDLDENDEFNEEGSSEEVEDLELQNRRSDIPKYPGKYSLELSKITELENSSLPDTSRFNASENIRDDTTIGGIGGIGGVSGYTRYPEASDEEDSDGSNEGATTFVVEEEMDDQMFTVNHSKEFRNTTANIATSASERTTTAGTKTISTLSSPDGKTPIFTDNRSHKLLTDNIVALRPERSDFSPTISPKSSAVTRVMDQEGRVAVGGRKKKRHDPLVISQEISTLSVDESVGNERTSGEMSNALKEMGAENSVNQKDESGESCFNRFSEALDRNVMIVVSDNSDNSAIYDSQNMSSPRTGPRCIQTDMSAIMPKDASFGTLSPNKSMDFSKSIVASMYRTSVDTTTNSINFNPKMLAETNRLMGSLPRRGPSVRARDTLSLRPKMINDSLNSVNLGDSNNLSAMRNDSNQSCNVTDDSVTSLSRLPRRVGGEDRRQISGGIKECGTKKKRNRIFEEFFIVGVSRETLMARRNDNAQYFEPEELIRFPNHSDNRECPKRKVVSDFCFPGGVRVRKLNMTESMSDMNTLLHGKTSVRNDENCFVFTLSAEEDEVEDGGAKNSTVLYGFCLKREQIISTVDIDYFGGTEKPLNVENHWVTEQVLCFLTYQPLFKLHFGVLTSIVSIQRYERMRRSLPRNNHGQPDTRTMEESAPNGVNIEVISLLSSYYNRKIPGPGDVVSLHVSEELPMILFENEKDFDADRLEAQWFCPTLLSVLHIEDFSFLFGALMCEKSLVIVSKNKAAVTSILLGLRSLLKPFHWPHVLIPLIPTKLLDLLDAPVPILVGVEELPSEYMIDPEAHENLLWVFLESEEILMPRGLNKAIKKFALDGIVDKISDLHKEFQAQLVKTSDMSVYKKEQYKKRGPFKRVHKLYSSSVNLRRPMIYCYSPTEAEEKVIFPIIDQIRNTFTDFSLMIPAPRIVDYMLDFGHVEEELLDSVRKEDRGFLKEFMQTQIFVHYMEEKYLKPYLSIAQGPDDP